MRRRGHLGEFEVVLIVALMGAGLAGLVGGWQLIARDPITVAVDGSPTLGGLAPGVHPDPSGQLQVVVDHPSGQQAAWEALRVVPWFGLVVFTLVVLLIVVHSARRGDPFSPANIRRLGLVGWVLLVGSGIAFVLEFMAVTALSESATTSDTASASASYSFLWAFSSLGFLAVAEVLKRGRALQAELAEVI